MPPPRGILSETSQTPYTRRYHASTSLPTALSSAPPRRAQTRKINPVTTSGAQCYPRLACPLNLSVLMQLHMTVKR
ncbi:hypothetical protein IE982_22710 [Enterobacter hormaechei]|nr:hypothetical protein [Enterobacter hormaechei]